MHPVYQYVPDLTAQSYVALCYPTPSRVEGGMPDPSGQAVMTSMAERVGKGDWLHIFPEGRVSKDGELGRLKWGLGKLLCDVEAMVRSAR